MMGPLGSTAGWCGAAEPNLPQHTPNTHTHTHLAGEAARGEVLHVGVLPVLAPRLPVLLHQLVHDVVARHARHVTKGGGGPAAEEAGLGEDALFVNDELRAVDHALERLTLALRQLHLDLLGGWLGGLGL